MKIRKFKNADAVIVSGFIRNCFLKLDIGGHTQRGIELQITGNSPESLIERAKTIKYFVATDNSRVIGICGHDDQKVHTLFVDINFQKRGIGKKLLETVLKDARADGLQSIITWSTIYAENFYHSFGFNKIKEVYLPEDKKHITLIEMIKYFA
jgi:N-acetylglutamate synthase-like GNAT family acetyltransferase